VDGWDLVQQAAELARRGEACALATVVWRQGPSSGQLGARAIITASGEVRGWIGGACAEPAVIREARAVIETGTARLLLLGSPEQFGYVGDQELPEGMAVIPIACQSRGALEVYVEPVLPAPHLVVVGSSPMASTLTDLARALGWQAELVGGADFTVAGLTERSLVVVATQGHDDEAVLERALAARPAYLGLVGSARRGAAVLGYLAERGAECESLQRVHFPAGLDLGHTTHREIAVAVLAELVQLRASGALAGVPAMGSGLSAGKQSASPADGAIDPVCGMAVEDVGPGSRTAEHEGRTYYFCGAGCQQAFGADPAAYAREARC
jgi:xanthine dehydrogenase accessory factor